MISVYQEILIFDFKKYNFDLVTISVLMEPFEVKKKDYQ